MSEPVFDPENEEFDGNEAVGDPDEYASKEFGADNPGPVEREEGQDDGSE